MAIKSYGSDTYVMNAAQNAFVAKGGSENG